MKHFIEKLQTEGYLNHMVEMSKHLNAIRGEKKKDFISPDTVGMMLGLIFEKDTELCDEFTDAVWDIGVHCITDAVKIEMKRDTTEDSDVEAVEGAIEIYIRNKKGVKE